MPLGCGGDGRAARARPGARAVCERARVSLKPGRGRHRPGAAAATLSQTRRPAPAPDFGRRRGDHRPSGRLFCTGAARPIHRLSGGIWFGRAGWERAPRIGERRAEIGDRALGTAATWAGSVDGLCKKAGVIHRGVGVFHKSNVDMWMDCA